MEFPSGLLYTKDHEWALHGSDDVVTVGITDHAQDALGDIVYVELPKIGRELKAHETFGVVESIKAVSDLYSPIAGTVVEVNEALTTDPSTLNRAPYKDGWLLRLKLTDKNSMKDLLNATQYTSFVESLR
jgi:glycine cleavage system H protein